MANQLEHSAPCTQFVYAPTEEPPRRNRNSPLQRQIQRIQATSLNRHRPPASPQPLQLHPLPALTTKMSRTPQCATLHPLLLSVLAMQDATARTTQRLQTPRHLSVLSDPKRATHTRTKICHPANESARSSSLLAPRPNNTRSHGVLPLTGGGICRKALVTPFPLVPKAFDPKCRTQQGASASTISLLPLSITHSPISFLLFSSFLPLRAVALAANLSRLYSACAHRPQMQSPW